MSAPATSSSFSQELISVSSPILAVKWTSSSANAASRHGFTLQSVYLSGDLWAHYCVSCCARNTASSYLGNMQVYLSQFLLYLKLFINFYYLICEFKVYHELRLIFVVGSLLAKIFSL